MTGKSLDFAAVLSAEELYATWLSMNRGGSYSLPKLNGVVMTPTATRLTSDLFDQKLREVWQINYGKEGSNSE
jgi:hypothetical protein